MSELKSHIGGLRKKLELMISYTDKVSGELRMKSIQMEELTKQLVEKDKKIEELRNMLKTLKEGKDDGMDSKAVISRIDNIVREIDNSISLLTR